MLLHPSGPLVLRRRLPLGGLGVEGLTLGAQLVGEHVRDEIFLGHEVGVEGAVGQAGVGHHGGHTGAVNAILFF